MRREKSPPYTSNFKRSNPGSNKPEAFTRDPENSQISEFDIDKISEKIFKDLVNECLENIPERKQLVLAASSNYDTELNSDLKEEEGDILEQPKYENWMDEQDIETYFDK